MIRFSFPAFLRGVLRGVQSLLFGFYKPTEGLFWVLLWAGVPFLFWRKRSPGVTENDSGRPLRRRMGFFLALSGLGGILMHILSFCIGYYLLPYCFALAAGGGILLFGKGKERERYLRRAFGFVAAGFITASFLLTFSYYRAAHLRLLRSTQGEIQVLSGALEKLPSGGKALRKIAVAGDWLSLYAVRLSHSQVYADMPDLSLWKDAARARKALSALRERGVVAVLLPRRLGAISARFGASPIEGSAWDCIVL